MWFIVIVQHVAAPFSHHSFVVPLSQRDDVKVFDFGLAKELTDKMEKDADGLYKLTAMAGSPRYMVSSMMDVKLKFLVSFLLGWLHSVSFSSSTHFQRHQKLPTNNPIITCAIHTLLGFSFGKCTWTRPPLKCTEWAVCETVSGMEKINVHLSNKLGPSPSSRWCVDPGVRKSVNAPTVLKSTKSCAMSVFESEVEMPMDWNINDDDRPLSFAEPKVLPWFLWKARILQKWSREWNEW
jgi:hypothetical protein